MPSFTPPVEPNEVPNFGPGDPAWAVNCLQHFSTGDRYRNVYILDGTIVTEDDPVAVYAQDGTLLRDSLQRTTRFFRGGSTYQVNAAEAALLTAAGYEVTP